LHHPYIVVPLPRSMSRIRLEIGVGCTFQFFIRDSAPSPFFTRLFLFLVIPNFCCCLDPLSSKPPVYHVICHFPRLQICPHHPDSSDHFESRMLGPTFRVWQFLVILNHQNVFTRLGSPNLCPPLPFRLGRTCHFRGASLWASGDFHTASRVARSSCWSSAAMIIAFRLLCDLRLPSLFPLFCFFF